MNVESIFTAPLWRGCLTVLAVGLVLWLLRRAGPRASGLTAAIPITSAPALAWMSSDQGPAFAAAAAAAALYATGLTGVFALSYAHAARRVSPMPALAAASGPVVLLAIAAPGLGASLEAALPLSIALLVACACSMPRAASAPGRRRSSSRRSAALTAAVSGAVTVLIGLYAPRVPAWLCGSIAAIPVIGLCTTVNVHAQGGAVTVVAFLRAYIDGLGAKLAFLAALAIALPRLPAAVSWPLAVACGLAVVWGLARRSTASIALQSFVRSVGSYRSPRVLLPCAFIPSWRSVLQDSSAGLDEEALSGPFHTGDPS